MKNKIILGIVIVATITASVSVVLLTNKKSDNNVSLNENSSTEEITTNNAKLTLETFKEAMNKRGLNVVDHNVSGNSINHPYIVEDKSHSSNYTLNIFETNEDAYRWWNTTTIKTSYYDEKHFSHTLKEENIDNINKSEIVGKNGTICIDYRENNCILSGVVQNDGGDDAQSFAEEIFEELGF